ncbi:MAG TPA: exodeoxyribonuclease III [Rickettsiales bacterium]|nr:exodeoxyribonuclease III [Rickettsiales bacterium]
MIIATYNINSIRIRLNTLKEVVDKTNPDILCLQETKVDDSLFPLESVQALGYPHIYFSGQKSYNGVAILSRIPLTNIHNLSIVNDDHKRHISATLPNGTELHNFYVPAGGDIPDRELNDKFDFKLRFMNFMAEWAQDMRNDKKSLIVVGDMNIAPLEHDVWSHKQLLGVVSHTPVEVEAMELFRKSFDFVDTSRHFAPAPAKLYSWWSYRNQDWKKSDRGRRLDHIWVTSDLQPKLKSSYILREARDFSNPSDHVPVVTEFDW